MHDHIVEYLGGRQHQPPVEGERASGGAGAPERALATNPDPSVDDSEPLGLLFGEGRTSSRAPTRTADSLTASRSSPSRGTWRRRCSSIQARLSRSTRSTSAWLIERGAVSRAGSPQGTSSRHRRARAERRTSTSSTCKTVAGGR